MTLRRPRPDQILLTAAELAQVTGGEWRNLSDQAAGFACVVKLAKAEPGALCVTFDRSKKWGKGENPPSAKELDRAAGRRAAGYIVGAGLVPDVAYPVLVVKSTVEALSAIAEANRDRAGAKRILVTGSVGKTNYKLMARHVLGSQMAVHAVPDSSNLDVPIWCSLASVQGRDQVAVFEVSVANPGRGRRRGAMIKPHVCVFTNISSSHTSYHGSVDNLIQAKAESVLGLEPGGVCLMDAEHPYFLPLKAAVQRLRPVPVLTWGKARHHDAWLESAAYDHAAGCWRVSAWVMGPR